MRSNSVTRPILIGQKLVENAKIEKSKYHILSAQKSIKIAKNGPFWRFFEKLKLAIKGQFSLDKNWWKMQTLCQIFSLKSALIFLILKLFRPCRKLRTVIFTSYAAVDMLKFIKTQSYKCTVVVQVLHLLGIISSQSRIFFAKGCRRRYGTILQNCYSIDNDIQNGWRRLSFPLLRPCVTKTFANFLEYNLD